MQKPEKIFYKREAQSTAGGCTRIYSGVEWLGLLSIKNKKLYLERSSSLLRGDATELHSVVGRLGLYMQ